VTEVFGFIWKPHLSLQTGQTFADDKVHFKFCCNHQPAPPPGCGLRVCVWLHPVITIIIIIIIITAIELSLGGSSPYRQNK
jgi:hypothetical protein